MYISKQVFISNTMHNNRILCYEHYTVPLYGGFLKSGVPLNHPFDFRIFDEINMNKPSSYFYRSTPMAMETPRV